MTDRHEQQCGEQRRMTGVLITCHRVRGHKGPHRSSSYGVRWRETGEVLPPPSPRRTREPVCESNGCTLWPDHAGPHGEQQVIAL